MDYWFEVNNADKILSPALLFYPDRIKANITSMLNIAGSPLRLRPHVKTYKCKEIIQMQIEAGISKFKCATLAEAYLLGEAGASDVLIAYPIIGPNQAKLIEINRQFPGTKFGCLVDHPAHLIEWQNSPHKGISLYIDLDPGMGRTGIQPTSAMNMLDQMIALKLPFGGLHVYDGQIHTSDPEERKKETEKSFTLAQSLIVPVQKKIGSDFEIVCGGSITFPIHALYPERTLSPGTTLLWDYGYQSNFPDLPFEIAATLLTRVISKPEKNRLCLDLGHKAVGSEMKGAPVFFPQLPLANIIIHSEEHLVIETDQAPAYQIGDILYGIPVHICPTVALHEKAAVIVDNLCTDFWNIIARKRFYQC